MPSSHRQQGQDKAVLSCLRRRLIGDKSRLSVTENFKTVLSSLTIGIGKYTYIAHYTIKNRL